MRSFRRCKLPRATTSVASSRKSRRPTAATRVSSCDNCDMSCGRPTGRPHSIAEKAEPNGVASMTRNCIGWMIFAVALCAPGSVLAQTSTPTHVPLQKTIGQAKPEIVPSLIVINARGASLQGGQLTLIGVAPNAIVFADRPVRAAGHSLTTDLLEEWAPSNDSDESFAKDPPNATVSVFSKDGSKIRDAVVVLKTPKLEGDRLTFDVDVLEGELTGDGPAAIFI